MFDLPNMDNSITGFKAISDENFQIEVLDTPGIILVEFYRNSCSSCKVFESTLVEFQNRYQGQMKFTRLNTDLGEYFQKKYNFIGAPTTAVFYSGQLQGEVVGASNLQVFENQFLPIIGKLVTKYNIQPVARKL